MGPFRAARAGISVVMSFMLVAGLAPAAVAVGAPAASGSNSTSTRDASAPASAKAQTSAPTRATAAPATAGSTAAQAAARIGCKIPTKIGDGPVCPPHGATSNPNLIWQTATPATGGATAKPAASGATARPATSAGDWPQYHHDAAHTGFNASESDISAANVASLSLAWTGAASGGSPVVADGRVYVLSSNGLTAYAVGCASGGASCTPLWSTPYLPSFHGSLAVANGAVYTVSDDGRLYAFDAAGIINCSGTATRSCRPLWKTDSDNLTQTAPVVANGVVYVGGLFDYKLNAYDAAGVTNCIGTDTKTCTPLWTTTSMGWPISWSASAVANGVVYIGTSNGRLFAFDAAGIINCTGSGPIACNPLWTANSGVLSTSPSIANGVVYIASDLGTLYAFDAAGVSNCSGSGTRTCTPIWTAATRDASASSPEVANGIVFEGSTAFDAAGVTNCSGVSARICSPLWTLATVGRIADSLAVANGVVYVGTQSDDKLYAFDAAGVANCSGTAKTCTPIWTGATQPNMGEGSPAVADGVVYTTAANTLYAFSLKRQLNGTVTAGASGLAGIEVDVISPDGQTLLADAQTASDGTWSADAPSGNYKICFYDSTGTYASGCLGDSAFTYDFTAARVVTVGTADISGLDIVLPLTVLITGTVTHGASPVAGLDVYFYDAALSQVGHTTTGADGHYSAALPPGSYLVQFWDTSLTYPNGFWSLSGLTQVRRFADMRTLGATDVDASVSLPTGFRITGTVTDSHSVGIAGIEIDVWTTGGDIPQWAYTDDTGAYTVVAEAGDYALGFNDLSGIYVSGFSNGTGFTSDPAQAYWFSVDAPLSVDITLPIHTGPLDHLVLSPASATIVSGGSQAYAAEGFDHNGNDLGDVTGATTFTIDSGTACPADSCTSTAPGDHTITGTDGIATGTATLHVNSQVPGKPTGVHASMGDSSAAISWAAPASDGGSAITAYTVTSSPGSKTCSWATGPLSCTVSDLTNGVSYTFTVTATNGVGPGPASDPSAAVTLGSTFHPITPVRLLDTRSGNGLSGPLQPFTPRTFQITGRDVIPAGATAVTGNLTVTDETSSYAVYLGPDPVTNPTSSTLNFVKGDVSANGVTVALGSGGALSATYMAPAGSTTNLVFDVTGYFTPDDSGATYHPITPVRLLDSRANNGLSGTLPANTPKTFQITGRSGIPTNATAVTGNLTVTDQ
ncbi:MAG TPA: PQQ-binding-like beta-propeller repeat protein, partial [Candidatus Limnocylindrales bacterium]